MTNKSLHIIDSFKPALKFVLVFVGCYFILSLIYGFFIESYGEKVDPWTLSVAKQCSSVLTWWGEPTEIFDTPNYRACTIGDAQQQGIAVFEGCNGLNVIILFVSFLIAYKGPVRKFWWFSLLGVITIHLVNLGRLILLYYVAKYYPTYMYFTHKYIFTAVIYASVFLLWYIWASKINAHPRPAKAA